ncbi:MAG TPA: TetR family transcriptional regulator [Acidimicrobiales bacterium]|nr:TetR family transcriptional regulator [Acidimicrobiales bacterium]
MPKARPTTTAVATAGPAENGADGHLTGRALRSDARRNIAKVLRAAEEVFADEGVTAPIDRVAERAGVGVGTVYRHFPSKHALFQAVVGARLEALFDRAEMLSDAADPGEALFAFVDDLVALAAEKKDLTDELASAGIDAEQVHADIRERLEEAFAGLLHRAQAVGAIRGDIEPEEVVTLLMATCMAAKRRPDASTQRLVSVIHDGLRARE